MIEELIDRLIDLNINIELEEQDKLKIHADISKIPGDLLAEIKLRKQDIVKYLAERQSTERFELIQQVPVQENYALSSSQRQLWIIGQFEDGNVAYNRPKALIFNTAPDLDALRKSFRILIERHEILRTVFRETNQGSVRQFIQSPEDTGFVIDYIDMRQQQEKVNALLQREFTKPFDLAKGPLFRACLLEVKHDEWIFGFVMHHIINDAWSMSILVKELMILYRACIEDKPNPLPPLRIQYKDYAAWQQEQLSGDHLMKHKSYWLKQFEGDLPVLDLPVGKVRPALRTYNGESFTTQISRHLSDGIKLLSQQQGATLFMGMLAAVNTLFYRYTSQEDIIIGTPIAGREHADLQDQIGFYANTLALRMQFKGDSSYRNLLDNAKKVTLGAYTHQIYPFDILVDDLKLQRDMSRNPLFDIQVIVENAESGNNESDVSKAAISNYNEVESPASVFDIVLFFVESANSLQINIIYNNDIYTRAAVSQLAIHLEQILAAIIAAPDKPINQLDFLSDSDRHQLLIDFNASSLQLNKEKTIIHLFEEQVSLAPDMVAVVFGDHQLTYLELDEQSGKLATYLHQTYHLQPGQLVGVMLDRSENLIIAMLAILKAGGVYVPIDPEYPGARKSYIITDTAIQVLITQTEYIFDLSYFQGDLFAIDVQLPAILEMESSFKALVKPLDLAYIIYTSGSTGLPKGVMIEHGALSASIQSQRTIFQIAAGTRSLQFTSPSFDVSVFEIFITLASGASLYIIREQDKKEPFLLERYITDNSIAVASIPPAFLRMLSVEGIRSLQKLITGGESAAFETVVSFAKSGTYYNAYGPTESSLCASVFSINGATELTSANIPIGRPIPGVELYVLDSRRSLVPVGVSGEIYIGGSGLARGYLNSPDLTAAKFIPNPFISGERMYSTGDIGRWLPDGNLEFIGRKDDQVKVNGYRIELGEVEKAIQSYAGIDAAVVITRPDKNGGNRLVGYIVSSEEISSADILSHLSKSLPSYMLPGHFVQLDHLPLTDNGKVDRKQLPDPEGIGMATSHEYVAPRTEAERTIVKIWEDVLDKTPIGVEDDYFELGGSSLKAMVVVKKILDVIGTVLPLKIVFEQKTIKNIAKYIDKATEVPATIHHSPMDLNDTELPEASYNQRNYFSEWNNQGDHLVVNPYYEYRHINIVAFRVAIKQLIERHEILRTAFSNEGKMVRQKIFDAKDVDFKIDDPVSLSSSNQFREIMRKEYFRNFDMGIPPLFRVQVYQLEDDQPVILITLHHVITDGYSGGVFKEELTELYTAIIENRDHRLKPLRFQYQDFSNWQRNFLNSAEGAKHQAYWVSKLSGFTQKVRFPITMESGALHNGRTIGITRSVKEEWYEELNRFSQSNGLTLTVVLMGSLVLLLNELSQQDDLTICTNVSGRNSAYYGELDVSGLIGFFANLLLVRTKIDKAKTVLEYLHQIQHDFLEDLAHDAYPIDKLINELPGITPAGFLQSTVFFNYHNYSYIKSGVLTVADADEEEERGGENPLPLALGLSVTEYQNTLAIQILFNSNLFPPYLRITIKDHYFLILDNLLQQPQSLISQLNADRRLQVTT
jgi:amino acid adenylation domain-containing protein